MPEALLVAENLTKDYGSFRALSGVSLSIAPGEVVGLLGPNAVSYTHLTLPTTERV